MAQGGTAVKAIGWGLAERGKAPDGGRGLFARVYPTINEWNNRREVQLEVKDFKLDEASEHAPTPPPPDPGREHPPRRRHRAGSRPRGSPIRACSTPWRGSPRGRFLPPEERAHATEDRALPIGLDQTISQPLMVAVMTVELDLSGSERVLEIGTGSGYQTAVLSLLAAEVFTVERLATLSLRARAIARRPGPDQYPLPDRRRLARLARRGKVRPRAGHRRRPGFPRSTLRSAPGGRHPGRSPRRVGRPGARAGSHAGRLPVKRKIMPCRFVKLIGQEGWADG